MAYVEPTTKLADIDPWAGNKLPKLSDTWVLTPSNAATFKVDKPFKLDVRSKGLVIDKVKIDSLRLKPN